MMLVLFEERDRHGIYILFTSFKEFIMLLQTRDVTWVENNIDELFGFTKSNGSIDEWGRELSRFVATWQK